MTLQVFYKRISSKKFGVSLGLHYFCTQNRYENHTMGYNMQDKLEWTIIFVREFGRKYGLTMKQAFNYLSRFKGIDFVDRNYAYSVLRLHVK